MLIFTSNVWVTIDINPCKFHLSLTVFVGPSGASIATYHESNEALDLTI
jgi:hypothetical protein